MSALLCTEFMHVGASWQSGSYADHLRCAPHTHDHEDYKQKCRDRGFQLRDTTKQPAAWWKEWATQGLSPMYSDDSDLEDEEAAERASNMAKAWDMSRQGAKREPSYDVSDSDSDADSNSDSGSSRKRAKRRSQEDSADVKARLKAEKKQAKKQAKAEKEAKVRMKLWRNRDRSMWEMRQIWHREREYARLRLDKRYKEREYLRMNAMNGRSVVLSSYHPREVAGIVKSVDRFMQPAHALRWKQHLADLHPEVVCTGCLRPTAKGEEFARLDLPGHFKHPYATRLTDSNGELAKAPSDFMLPRYCPVWDLPQHPIRENVLLRNPAPLG